MQDWQRDIFTQLGEIKADQREIKAIQQNLHEKLDAFIEEQNKLSKTVYGNGKPGLAEEVRNIKGRWAAIVSVSVIVVSAAIDGLFRHFFR